MMKHTYGTTLLNVTQGKWDATQYTSDEYEIWTEEGVFIATTEPNVNVRDAFRPGPYARKANANLIAASPAMLQELKAVALGLENTDSDWAKERLEYVRAIIAKAEGK